MNVRAWLTAALVCAAALAQDPPNQEPAKAEPAKSARRFDAKAFAAYAQQKGASAELIAAFEKEPQAGTADTLMRAIHPGYGAAVTLAESGSPEAAVKLAQVLAGAGSDLRLEAHARYHLGRAFLDRDDPEHALAILGPFVERCLGQSALDAEACYFLAHALVQVPDPERAKLALQTFLASYSGRGTGEAPERYLASAKQMLAELEGQADNPLHGIADTMKNCERHIKRTDTGKETQDKQQQVLTKLEEIIKMLEEQEKQSGGAPSGNQASGNPANKSAAPPGAARIGSLDKVNGVADRWGMMKDAERKAIENDIATKLPPQFSKMLEEYTKKLGKGAGK